MKRLARVSMILTAMMVLLSSCNGYKKMQKEVDVIDTKCVPEVLTLKGSTVTADITVTFPPKYFYEEIVLKITPVLVYEGGEIPGTPKFVQGEKVKDNYTVISWKKGGSYTQTVTFPYNPKANLSTLELRIEGKCADKCRKKNINFAPFAAVAVAQGISAVQNDADYASAMLIMPDNFSRITTISENAEIKYLINSAKVRKTELTQEQIKLFEDFVKENSNKSKVTLGNVYAKGYASPDGPVAFNDKLSKKRSESGEKAMKESLKDVNVTYDVSSYGEDWEGFKKLVEASDIEDKDLILQVLAMYSSPVERDKEIMNMSSVFEVLKKEILPQLRRTQFVVSADVEGLSDAELIAAATKGDKNLNVEEMLYAASLVKDNAQKANIYKLAANQYNDVRAYNNLGVVLAQTGDMTDAKKALETAAKLQSTPQISNNLAVLAIAEGDYATAKRYLSALKGDQVKQTKGLLALAEGDYTAAAKELDGYNLAVAETLNGNYAKAKAAISKCNDADCEYLKGVIAMREGDTKAAIAYLKSAIAKNPALKEKAQKDIEFAKLFGTSEFLAL